MPTYTELLPATKSEKRGVLTWEPAAGDTHVAGVLTLSGTRSHCSYRVEEFPADMGRGFMLFKLLPGTDKTEERYGVYCGTDGRMACECKGFARFAACKHATALTELITAQQL